MSIMSESDWDLSLLKEQRDQLVDVINNRDWTKYSEALANRKARLVNVNKSIEELEQKIESKE